MRVEVVTIGNEILSGRTVDTNFAFLARALEEVSVRVGWHATVGDANEAIADALRLALDRADAVILMGGLGPTPDDLTRKAVATVLSRPLQLNETVLEDIRQRARKMRRKFPAAVESQALIPRGAQTWKNPAGTAPGLLMIQDDKPVILLPGVPQELEALASRFVVPYLQERSGICVETFTLRTAGVPESMIHDKIGSLPQSWPGTSLAYLPSYFGVDVRVTVAGEDADRVNEVTGRAYDELIERIAPIVYAEGRQPMEAVVGELLVESNATLAVAESCTGGLLAKRLTDVPGASRYFERGFVTYSNAAKSALLGVPEATIAAHGAVSEPVAAAMAEGARARAAVDVALAITGIAGPDGGTAEKPVGLVYIACAAASSTAVREYKFVGSRQTVRERSVQAALDLVRRHLQNLPLEAVLE